MTEKSAPTVASAAPEEKIIAKSAVAKKPAKARNPDAKPKAKTHPSTAFMVIAAIKTLAERSGSSLQAIKKFITATYKLDAEKHSPFIKKFLRSAVTDGSVIQVKGKGANGSFKLPVSKSKPTGPKAKPKSKPKAAGVKTAEKKPAVKKAEGKMVAKPKTAVKKAAPKKEVKKATGEKKVAAKPSASKAVKAKTASPKAKKVAKSPTAKPKAPKPKKVTGKGVKAVAKK